MNPKWFLSMVPTKDQLAEKIEYGRCDASGEKNFEKIVRKRRSVKYFDPNMRVLDSDLHEILEIASLAPSAFNLQHWQIIDLSEKNVRDKIERFVYFQPQIKRASVLLAVVLDNAAWRCASRINHIFGSNDREKAESKLSELYRENATLARDEAMRACAMFSMNILLAAEYKGYQACPMSGLDYLAMHKMLQLPEEKEVCMLIAIGIADRENKTTPQRRLMVDQFFTKIN